MDAKCHVCNKQIQCLCDAELRSGTRPKELTCINSDSTPYARLTPTDGRLKLAHFCSKTCVNKHESNTGQRPTFLEDNLLAMVRAQMMKQSLNKKQAVNDQETSSDETSEDEAKPTCACKPVSTPFQVRHEIDKLHALICMLTERITALEIAKSE